MSNESKITLEFQAAAGDATVVSISGAADKLHEDPNRIQELLDLLRVPKGTQVKIVTTAASAIVR
jgi:hypothetical protein